MSNLYTPPPETPCDAFIRCVQAMGLAQDRMNPPPALDPDRYNAPKPPRRRMGMKRITADFTPHERALFRALSLKFPPTKCIEMVIRARSGGGR